jgi:hypothetical protein
MRCADIKRVRFSGGASDFHSGGSCFEYRLGHNGQYWPDFVVFLITSTCMFWICPRSENYRFLSHPCQYKSIPLQAWTDTEGSRSLRLPDFNTICTWRWQGCQPYVLVAFTPGIIPDTHFCERLSQPQGHSIYIYIYGPTFGNAESRLFLFAALCFKHWINAESFPVSELCVNTLPVTKITLITDGI